MTSLFISYSRRDAEFARKLTKAFEGQNLDFWIDWEGIPPTVDWWQEIEKGIEEADIFVFLLSPDSVKSKVCRQEIEHAGRNGKRLIPLVVRDIEADESPSELGHLNWIFVRETDDFDIAFDKLITAIRTDYAWVQTHRQIQVKALEWERNNWENSFLLRGKELENAETQLVINSSKEPRPTDLQREYVLKSRQVTNRQRRITTGVAIAGVIALAALAIFGFVQAGLATEEASQRATAQANTEIESDRRATAQAIAEQNQSLAEERAMIALARQLEAQAINLADDSIDQALLLSMEAIRISPSDEVNSNLLNILETSPKLSSYIHTHQTAVHGVAFDPNRTGFATGSIDGIINIWDFTTGKQLGSLNIGAVETLVFSADAQMLAAGHDNGVIDLWEVGTGKLIHSFQHNQDKIKSLAFSPNGEVLASGSRDQTVFLWNVNTGRPIFPSLKGHSALVGSLAFSPDGDMLASGDDGSNIILWDTSSGQRIGSMLRGHTSWVLSLAFSPDGKTLASGSGDSRIILWDLQDHQQTGQFIGHTSWVHSLTFSPDGSVLASGGQDGLILLWDTKTKQLMDRSLTGHTHAVLSLAFASDNVSLLSGGGDGTAIRWNIRGITRVGKIILENSTRIYSVAFSPNGKMLASGDLWDGGVALWDVESQTTIGDPLIGHDGRIRSLAFSPNGDILASAGDDQTVILWDVQSHKKVVQLQGHRDQVMSVAFSPDGQLIASGSKDSSIIIWSITTQQPIMKLQNGHLSWVMSVAFSPNGQYLASGGWDKMIWLWDMTTGTGVQLVRDNLDLVSSVSFSADGQWLASGGHPGEIYLWDVNNQIPMEDIISGHRSGVNSLRYSSDGKFLASGSGDGTVILWDLTTLQQYAQFPVSNESVSSVAFSPDNMRLATGGCDRTSSNGLCLGGKIIIWNLDPAFWKEVACQVSGRNLSQREWTNYLEDQPYHVTCPEWPPGK